MLALQAVLERRATPAMLLLLATQVIDGIDGPMARAANVKERVPLIDGYVLDLVIDFVTCVVVPIAFIYQFHLLPSAFSLALLGLAVFSAAIWFSRTDMMTEDHWFRGFPATWNLVAPTLYLLHASRVAGAVVVIVLSLASLTDIPVPHPVRVVWMRGFTLPCTVLWLTALVVEVIAKSHSPQVLRGFLLLGPLCFVGLSAARMLGWDRDTAVNISNQ
ncbi:MAG: hypothetical protein F2873_07945 [Actinobacteria bacterium]|uniref:Unannotated protein n=1 Tax=freshwater metagenome TaxID=449393 RepID=A0A6J7P532_9ZZZZ|nr:hypothetical protein [Actinomycetota bacterium]